VNIHLTDEQTLCGWADGLTLKVTDIDKFIAEGFWYELYTLDCSKLDTDFFVVRKCISDTEFDTFVCFKQYDIEYGHRKNFDFLFDGDEYRRELVNADGVVFNEKLVGVDCLVETMGLEKAGKISEYQGPDNEENPFIFAFETMNEDTDESFIQYMSGCRVNEKEVEFL